MVDKWGSVVQPLDQEDHVLVHGTSLVSILWNLVPTMSRVLFFQSYCVWGWSMTSLLFISITFAWCRKCRRFHGRQSGGLSRKGWPRECQRLNLSIGHSAIRCQLVSSSSRQSLQVGETSGLTNDSCLLSLLWPVIIWIMRPSSALGSVRSCLDALTCKDGNQILDCLAWLR